MFRGRQPFQVVPGTNIALSRKLFLDVGGFDERLGPGTWFPAGEDRDLSLRLLDHGCEVRHVPDSVVLHRSWRTRRDRLFVRWRYARGVGAFYAKHALRRDRHIRDLGAREVLVRLRAVGATAGSSPITAVGHLVSLAGLLTGASGWVVKRGSDRRSRCQAIALAYHSLADLRSDALLAEYGVPAGELADQLDGLIRRGWKFVDLDTLLTGLRGERRLPRRALLLTFDDGYADLLSAGAPILTARGIPALAFVVSGRVGASNDWDQGLGATPLPLLDRAGVLALAEHRIEVGSHTRSHPHLAELSPEDLRLESEGSAADLERLGLRRPRAFAYPYGEHSPEVLGAVRQAGYDVAFTASPGVITAHAERLALPRIEVSSRDSGWRLRLKLLTAGWPRKVRRKAWRLAGIGK